MVSPSIFIFIAAFVARQRKKKYSEQILLLLYFLLLLFPFFFRSPRYSRQTYTIEWETSFHIPYMAKTSREPFRDFATSLFVCSLPSSLLPLILSIGRLVGTETVYLLVNKVYSTKRKNIRRRGIGIRFGKL